MKRKLCVASCLLAAIITLMMVFTSCKSNNSTSPSNEPFSAKVSGDISLDFSAQLTNITLSNNASSGYTLRLLTASMNSGGKSYMMSLAVIDSLKGNSSFDVSKLQATVLLKVLNSTNSSYSYFADGEITLTTLDDNNWVGSFHFDASNIDSTKHVKVYNGNINVHK